MAVIFLKNGDKIETKEDASVVNAKYNEADYRDTQELMRWMGSSGDRPFPNPHNLFKVTEKETGKEISISPQWIKELPHVNTKNAVVTLTSGKKIVVSEDFDTVYSNWKNESVILLTEKNTGKRLALRTQNIEMLEEG